MQATHQSFYGCVLKWRFSAEPFNLDGFVILSTCWSHHFKRMFQLLFLTNSSQTIYGQLPTHTCAIGSR